MSAPLMISVSGIRGIVGASMTPTTAVEFAGAFGSYLRGEGVAAPVVCLGRDSRPSGQMFASAAAAGLTSVGCTVVDLGVVATPSVGVMIAERSADAGIVITASHNPLPWNGLKFLNRDGVAPPPEQSAAIIDRFHRQELLHVEVEAIRPIQVDIRGTEIHVQRVLTQIDPDPIRACGFTVVLDSVNGAGCLGGRMLLEQLGCRVVHLNGEPTGRFAHPPEPLREHLTDLCDAVRGNTADVGFAQDPDADRLAIVDESGGWIGEECTLALAVRHMLASRGPGAVVANLSTSRMIDDIAADVPGSTIVRTAVGEANVVEGMKRANATIGGEGNGGLIFPPVCWVRDSLSAMALILQMLASELRPLSAIAGELPRYVQIKEKQDLESVGGRSVLEELLEHIAGSFDNAAVDRCDGVRVDLDEGWVHVRPSNTEPIMRVIAEAPTEAAARELVERVKGIVAGARTG